MTQLESILVTILVILMIVSAIVAIIVASLADPAFNGIKYYVKRNEPITTYDLERYRFKSDRTYNKALKYLEENGYELVEYTEPEKLHIAGVGTIHFEDGAVEYLVYKSKNSLFHTSAENFKWYKEHVGENVTINGICQRYMKVAKEEENK